MPGIIIVLLSRLLIKYNNKYTIILFKIGNPIMSTAINL